MIEPKPNVAQQIAQAAIAFQQECTGHAPESVTVLLAESTLLVTLHDALSPGEMEMARTLDGAAKVQEFHQQLFHSSAPELHLHLNRILGVEVREAALEMELTTGPIFHAFPSGTLIQVFQLSQDVPTQAWSTRKGQCIAPAIEQ